MRILETVEKFEFQFLFVLERNKKNLDLRYSHIYSKNREREVHLAHILIPSLVL